MITTMRRTLALLAIITGLIFAAGQSFGQMTLTGAGSSKAAASASCSFPSASGLIGRYRADTGTSHPGGLVTAVVNQANPGTNDLVDAGIGTGVPYNAASSYNGHPAFDFVAANAAALTTTTFPIGTGDLSVFAVARMETGTASHGGLVTYGVSGNDYSTPGNGAFLKRDGSSSNISSDNTTMGSLSAASTTGANHRFGVTFQSFTGGVNLYVDNVLGANSGAAVVWISDGQLVIGNRYSSGAPGGGAWQGANLEVDIWNVVLGSTDLNTLDTYYTCQYGT
jgi:hypothetical protein